MASRTIQECDLSKTEYDPDSTVTIVFKRKGKRGRQYDLSAESAETLEQAFVSTEAHKIVPVQRMSGHRQDGSSESRPDTEDLSTKRTVGDFDIDSDDALIAEKERGRKEFNETLENHPEEIITVQPPVTEEQERCLHANKTPKRPKTVGKKRGFYQECKDCGKLIKARSMKSQRAYLAAQAPK